MLGFLLILVLPPAIFYGWFELQSRATVDRNALDPGFANALKHADAAATVYSVLRLVGVSAGAAENSAVKLGIINEQVEIYVKRGSKDSTIEMMRDFHNNMVGITVAKWRYSLTASDRRSRSEQLVALARTGVLLRSRHDISLSPEEAHRAEQGADIDWAINWFRRNMAAIEKRTMQSLRETGL
ncbi:MAG TPA: hypothetical protein VFB68_01640 [Xanthobacteraceae bacterium]|nr:hypothetical protein [Xanthobacteraceae bacterium]